LGWVAGWCRRLVGGREMRMGAIALGGFVAAMGRFAGLGGGVMAGLAFELREYGSEVVEKGQEVGDSRGEVREERREVRHDVVNGKPVKTVRDAKDLADDRRDRADDKRDRGLEVASLVKKRSIRDRYQALRGRFAGGFRAATRGPVRRAETHDLRRSCQLQPERRGEPQRKQGRAEREQRLHADGG